MNTHKCSLSLECKSKTCGHAKPHEANGCDCSAPCGQWPDNKYFQPSVKCIPVEQVKPPEDCQYCGKKEAKNHHQGDCVASLKQQRDELLSWKQKALEIYPNTDRLIAIRAKAKAVQS